jgi:hypothetical protein
VKRLILFESSIKYRRHEMLEYDFTVYLKFLGLDLPSDIISAVMQGDMGYFAITDPSLDRSREFMFGIVMGLYIPYSTR